MTLFGSLLKPELRFIIEIARTLYQKNISSYCVTHVHLPVHQYLHLLLISPPTRKFAWQYMYALNFKEIMMTKIFLLDCVKSLAAIRLLA